MRRPEIQADQPFVSGMQEAAIGVHEIYLTYLHAGFSKEQALKITLHQLTLAHECPNHKHHE